jgi:hypothetical protein
MSTPHTQQKRAEFIEGKEKQSPTTPSVEIVDSLFELIPTGKMTQLLSLGPALNGLEIGSGLVTVIGAPPGAGKTTLAMQVAFVVRLHNPGFRVVVANRESSMEVLLQRELARQTGVSSKAIRFGSCNATELAKLQRAVDELRPLLTRMSSLDEPGQLSMLMRLLSEEPGLLILDYIQKFAPPGEAKVGVTAVMTMCRQFARAGWAVLALSATARTKTDGDRAKTPKNLTKRRFATRLKSNFKPTPLTFCGTWRKKDRWPKSEQLQLWDDARDAYAPHFVRLADGTPRI